MSEWVSPNFTLLREVISSAKGRLLLCSPYVSTYALNVVTDALPSKGISEIEVWTKLSMRDWITGASDAEGLLDFVKGVSLDGRHVSIRQQDNLHAKIFISDGNKALAGSANLTGGGFNRNIEIGRLVTGVETERLRATVSQMRSKLWPVSMEDLQVFVSECSSKADVKESLLDLIREESPDTSVTGNLFVSFTDFKRFLQRNRSSLAKETLAIANNTDGNNNTGKVKQALYGVQRFLQEYPAYRSIVESLPLEWFELENNPLMLQDWKQFLEDFSNEVNGDYAYSVPTLRGYLPTSVGGTLRRGGGGNNELKRVWPLVGRVLRQRP